MDPEYHPRWPDADHDRFPRTMKLAADLTAAKEIGIRLLAFSLEHRLAIERHRGRVGEFEVLRV